MTVRTHALRRPVSPPGILLPEYLQTQPLVVFTGILRKRYSLYERISEEIPSISSTNPLILDICRVSDGHGRRGKEDIRLAADSLLSADG